MYLPGEQITLNTATGAATGIRYFDLPGGGTAYRTGTGINYGYETDDQQGTSLLSLNYTAQSPTWRQQTPYGAPRGTTATWIDNHAFLDKPADPATGLDIIGARSAVPWMENEYEHNYIAQMVVNGLVVTAAVALCPETAGLTCGVAVAFVAGGATNTFAYQVSNKRRSAAGYASSFVIGGVASAVPQASFAGTVKWAAPLTLTRSEKILLRNPIVGGNTTGSLLFWGKAGYLWLGIKAGKWLYE